MALMTLTPVVATADPAAARSPTYHACVARSGGQQAAYQTCAADEAARVDRALTAAYDRRIRAGSPASRRRLRDAERNWIARREATCGAKYRHALPGQEASASYHLCMADAAIARAAALSGR